MAVTNEYSVVAKQWQKWAVGNGLPQYVFNETFAELNKDPDFDDGDKTARGWNAAFIAAHHAREFILAEKERLRQIE